MQTADKIRTSVQVLLTPSVARGRLVTLLQRAHAGELAAALAYDGHARSVKDEAERRELEEIRDEELHHRQRLGLMLQGLGAAPDPRRERLLTLIGRFISWFCGVGGWYVPMYGAGKLERGNIVEYEHAAKLAHAAGLTELVDELLTFAEVEWKHELYFRQKVHTHWGRYLIPCWGAPPPLAAIRSDYSAHTVKLRAQLRS
jgi:rubrerythrin